MGFQLRGLVMFGKSALTLGLILLSSGASAAILTTVSNLGQSIG